LTSAPGFTPGRPPEWDLAIFLHGDELQTALITLERNRRTFAWKCWDVDSDGLQLRLGPSAITLGGLLKHLALCEEMKFQSDLTCAPLLPEFRDIDHESTWETWAWESAKDDDPEVLRDLWVRAVHRSRDTLAAILAESGLDHAAPEGGMSLRRLISDPLRNTPGTPATPTSSAKLSTGPPARARQGTSPFPSREDLFTCM